MIGQAITEAQGITRTLAATADTLIPNPELVTNALVYLGSVVEQMKRWQPAVVGIPPRAGVKPCQVCGVMVATERFKVTRPPGSGTVGGHGAGLYVDERCIERARTQIMASYPDPVQVSALLDEVCDGIIPTLLVLEDRVDISKQYARAKGIELSLRSWVGWV